MTKSAPIRFCSPRIIERRVMFGKENYEKLPREMKEQKRWCLWKKVERDGKMSKIPLSAIDGKGAKSNDESTWVTYQEALEGLQRYHCEGLGFMLGGGYFGVDIDHAIDDKALISEFVDTLNSYTELSQSKEGIHIICKGVLPIGNKRKGNIEMYDNARFFALTGDVYENHYELNERTDEIKALHAKYLGSSQIYTKKEIKPNSKPAIALMPNDEEVVSKALASRNSILFSSLYYGQWEGTYQSQSQADLALCSFLAFWTNKDPVQMDRIFRKSKLYREKWDGQRGEHTYGEITIQRAIATCQNTYDPISSNTDVSAITYDPTTGEIKTKTKNYDLSDTGNARRFVDTYGNWIRYNFDNKTWVIYDGKTWVKDTTQQVKNLADKMIKEMQKEYFDTYESDKNKADLMLKNIKHLSSSSGKEAMLKEALHIKEIATLNKDYDANPYLLNCENGIVNLRTGELMPHDRSLMLSKNTHIEVDMSNEPKEWIKTLKGIFQEDNGVISFVKRAIGYTLTGDTKEQCFFQCHGNGANGKSVFLNTINGIMGDYAINAQVDSILTRGASNGGNANPDIARMNGARFVRTNEPNEGARFNEGLVKQLTGGNDRITARFLYGSDFEFTPVFKLWIACNYKIGVRGTDKGIWRRMRLIPFEAEFEGKNDDKGLEARIKNEFPQILGWAIKGCLEWQEEGLPMPERIQRATNEYRDEMDIIRSFCKDNLKARPLGKVKASAMFKAYREWARVGNEYIMSQSKFGLEMAKKYRKQNINGYIYYVGCELKEVDESTYTYIKPRDMGQSTASSDYVERFLED